MQMKEGLYMTFEEALEMVKMYNGEYDVCKHSFDFTDEHTKLIKTALEKQIPFKPENQRVNFRIKMGNCYCCKTVFPSENYCPKCGQKLDWGE